MAVSQLRPISAQGDLVSRRADPPSQAVVPSAIPSHLHHQPRRTMASNWVTGSYMNGQQRPERYPPTDEHWLELNRRLGRWGGGETWRRLEHLGAIAKTD